ncbi:MAG: four-carbon acid sugar kinase family protein [Cyclobacteriaceae bacterium]
MYQKVEDVMAKLPPESERELLPVIRAEFLKAGKTIVVLDDDPTGTQTCYDVNVLTSWQVPIVVEELKKNPSILFILTNSRSMPEHTAIALAEEVGQNLTQAVKESGRQIAVVSRSDSTLRGHFPAEVDAVARALNIEAAVRVLVPAFIEGGRFTIDDVHYIRENADLVPVADTPFARDTVFGYKHSNMKEWVAEKTGGRMKASRVVSISLQDIRIKGYAAVADKLANCLPGEVCIVNACSYKDLEVLVMALLLAEKAGATFLYRTSATFVSIRAGISPGKILKPPIKEIISKNGSLVVVGSYVPKTTRQLSDLVGKGTHHSIEIDVSGLLRSKNTRSYAEMIIAQTDKLLSEQKDVVIHTSRTLVTGSNAESSLKINNTVSSFLVMIVKGLSVRPSFMVAKGGITSSDLATKGLTAQKALILGQIIAGVPVWKLDIKSKFPELIYVVFPGNVGDDAAFTEVCSKLKA